MVVKTLSEQLRLLKSKMSASVTVEIKAGLEGAGVYGHA